MKPPIKQDLIQIIEIFDEYWSRTGEFKGSYISQKNEENEPYIISVFKGNSGLGHLFCELIRTLREADPELYRRYTLSDPADPVNCASGLCERVIKEYKESLDQE